ncbi:glycosyltransferase [Mycobacterium sp. shizuoka-1]|uniref:glycosyltransferase n=1 Tax=Mycobacterium sp. shizuoka-1 TaxID=2039281 RepID=UPI000C05DC6F|nr:glycosyltransferase [Mycobacterium sp. shizuoka-1]GAY18962.1 glycosyl transferase [Mycobacterium sp. shizuoka-1]
MISEHASPLVHDGLPAETQSAMVAGLSAALARLGHEVVVYTRRDTPDGPDQVTVAPGYTVVHVPAGPARQLNDDELLCCTGEFADFLDSAWEIDPPDVAHGYLWLSGLATHLAARAHDVATVQTFRTLGAVEHRHGVHEANLEVRLKLETLVARQASWVVATSTDELSDLIALGRSRSRSSVIPCGVDVDVFSTEGPIAERGARHRLLAVGKILPRNGFDTMIEALPAIPDAEYVIVGGVMDGNFGADPEVRRLRGLADDLGVSDRVVFVGAVAHTDMPAMLRSADVVTSTPAYESFGLVSLEAMACGIPVVASAVGGMLDTVVDDVTGRLVPPHRPRECAEAVTGILRDSFRRRSLGLAGRDRACARYTWDRVGADTSRIYDRLAATQDEKRHLATQSA